MAREQLSDNFYLDEFLISQTAERHGIDMSPSTEVFAQLVRLCQYVLQPVREYTERPIHITSGYRPPELNTRIGGAAKSQHQFGQAADLIISGLTPLAGAKEFVNAHTPFDQLIHEFGRWIHVSIAAEGEGRGEMLTVYRVEGTARYVKGLYSREDFTRRSS